MTQQIQQPPKAPPKWLFKNIINPTMMTILRSPLHAMLSKGLLILTFKGRKSGKTFHTPVAYHQLADGTVMVMTRSPWWKNIDRGEPITVRLRGKTRPATAEIIHDNAVVWEYITQFLAQHNDLRAVGIMIPPDSPPEAIRAAASDLRGVKITLH